jgi:hypothetical protein
MHRSSVRPHLFTGTSLLPVWLASVGFWDAEAFVRLQLPLIPHHPLGKAATQLAVAHVVGQLADVAPTPGQCATNYQRGAMSQAAPGIQLACLKS